MTKKDIIIKINNPQDTRAPIEWCVKYREEYDESGVLDWFIVGNGNFNGEEYKTCSFIFHDDDFAMQFKLMGF